jgi:aminoacylase
VASPDDTFNIYYAERSIWHVHFTVPGHTGHGSMLLKNTAGEKVRNLLDRFIDYRKTQVKLLDDHPELTIGDVTTVNITMLQGGVQSNVIPPEYKVTVDMRLSLDVDHQEFENMFRKWCDQAGEGITYTFEQKQPKVPPTNIDKTNLYWSAFKAAVDEL